MYYNCNITSKPVGEWIVLVYTFMQGLIQYLSEILLSVTCIWVEIRLAISVWISRFSRQWTFQGHPGALTFQRKLKTAKLRQGSHAFHNIFGLNYGHFDSFAVTLSVLPLCFSLNFTFPSYVALVSSVNEALKTCHKNSKSSRWYPSPELIYFLVCL